MERRRRRGGLCSSHCLEKSEGSGETAWALPLYLGAVVATFSQAEWQLVPLGCWLAEPRGRPQATGQRVWEDSKGLRRVRDPPWDPRPPHPNTHTLGRVGDISQGTRSFSPLHGKGQPLLRRLRQYYRPPHPGSHPSPPRATECPYRPSPNPQGKSLPGRGGQARLGVGLWRPGPGTQRRKFQAVTPGCLQGGRSDRQRIQRCGFLHLAPSLLALATWPSNWELEGKTWGSLAHPGRASEGASGGGSTGPSACQSLLATDPWGAAPAVWLRVGSWRGWQVGTQMPG